MEVPNTSSRMGDYHNQDILVEHNEKVVIDGIDAK